MRRALWIGAGLAAMAAAGGLYFGSPLMAVQDLKGALRSGDRDRLEQVVDFPSVRENLKSQVSAAVVAQVAGDPQLRSNPFSGLALMLGPAIADRLIDSAVTPDGLAALIARGKLEPAAQQPRATSQAPLKDFRWGYHGNLDTFTVSSPEGENGPVLVLKRHGFAGWKLARVDLPKAVLAPARSTDEATPSDQAPPPTPEAQTPAMGSAEAPTPDTIAQLSPRDAAAFSRYAVAEYAGPIVRPDFNGRDRSARMFRTRVLDGVSEGPVFAGRLAVALFGCGTDCSMGYVIDVSTGRVFPLPVGGENQPDLSLLYVKDSALMRANWNSAPADTTTNHCVYQDFVWTGAAFRPLPSRDDSRPCPPPS
jgi:hypothetical protein